MTSDPDGAARFYGAVVGWTIAAHSDPATSGVDYRMIGRSDGGNAGGVLGLNADMLAGGARPAWLGYLHPPGVHATIEAFMADGGAVLLPATALPVGPTCARPDPVGPAFISMN